MFFFIKKTHHKEGQIAQETEEQKVELTRHR